MSFSRITGQSPVGDSLLSAQRSAGMSHTEMRGGQLFTRGRNAALDVQCAQTLVLHYDTEVILIYAST